MPEYPDQNLVRSIENSCE